MFKLTKQEQVLVAFLVAAIVLGTIVRQWRAHAASKEAKPAGIVEKRGP